MAPVAGHLHVHDGFGRPQGFFQGYHPQENTALGIGDLHMPLGWGDIAWEAIFSELEVLPDTVLMMEIGARYAAEQPASLVRAKALAALADRREAIAAE
jgi:sugar phosphate isomerase/epimerase